MGRGSCRGRFIPLLTVAFLLAFTVPSQGQFSSLVTQLFGDSSSANTPATPTVISTTTPSSTPSATPSATPAATPAATKAAASTTATPAATKAPQADATSAAAPATEAASPAAADAVSAASPTTAAAASPDDAIVVEPMPVKTPAPTKKAALPPPPPSPIVIDQAKLVPALPAVQTAVSPAAAPPASGSGNDTSDITAVDVVLQLAGSGVTPFVVPQQTVLLRSMASVLTTVSLSDLRIRYVTSAANSRRRLLAEDIEIEPQVRRGLLAGAPALAAAAAAAGQLVDVASVTLEANCSSAGAVPATLAEMQSVVDNNLLASAIQAYGQPTWGVSLLSLTAVNPNVALQTASSCRKRMGSLCLDGTSLSVAAVQVIIGIGCVVVAMLLVIPCVILEWRRKSGQLAELDPTPQTPKTPLDRVQQMYNKFINTVKQASPMHRSLHSRSAFSESPTSATSIKAQEGGGIVNLTARPTYRP